MKKLSLILTLFLAHLSPALAGGVYNRDSFNQYHQQQQEMQQQMPQMGPSRPWNYRDEEGFNHRCLQHGNTIDCQD